MLKSVEDMLMEQIDVLKERVRQLEDALIPPAIVARVEWSLTSSEQKVFAHLVSRELATKQSIMFALYSDRPDDGPELKIVDVFVCKMRRKLKPFDVQIDTVWGQGYSLRDRERFLPNAWPVPVPVPA